MKNKCCIPTNLKPLDFGQYYCTKCGKVFSVVNRIKINYKKKG